MEQKLCPGCEEPVIDKLPGCPLQCRTVQCKAYQKKPIYDYDLMPIVWVMGGPGSGKLTQCKKMVSTYGLTYLSPGQMIRQEIESGSDRARCLYSVTGRGGLVPNDLVLALLKEAIEKAAAKGTRGFIINGFPREKAQGPQFERTVGRCSLIFYLSATVNTMYTRMRQRPKNPHRIDETPLAMKLRLETYMRHYESIVELYKYRLVKINAEKPADAAFADMMTPMDIVMENASAARKAAKAREQAATLKEQHPSMPLESQAAKTNEQIAAFSEQQTIMPTARKDAKISEQVVTSNEQAGTLNKEQPSSPKESKAAKTNGPVATIDEQLPSMPTAPKDTNTNEQQPSMPTAPKDTNEQQPSMPTAPKDTNTDEQQPSMPTAPKDTNTNEQQPSMPTAPKDTNTNEQQPSMPTGSKQPSETKTNK